MDNDFAEWGQLDYQAYYVEYATQLTIYSGNGGPMTAKLLTAPFNDLSIQQSLSRPHVSNNTPTPKLSLG